MTAGLSAANLANKWLDMLAGTAFTAPAAFWVALHTGDPGSAGTANASAVTTRQQVTWSAASGGSKSQSTSPTAWSMTATETIAYVSFWDASTAGNFLGSAAVTTSRSVVNGDTITLNTLTIAFTPIAA
jgi:hypothetical protein